MGSDCRRHNPKLLYVVGEFIREALAIECRRRIDADHTVTVLARARLVTELGTAPASVRCDNGPESRPTRSDTGRCRLTAAGSVHIEPGSPWHNAHVERFGSRIRDELLTVELFA